MHPSRWLQYNPFYDLFYSTASMAITVAVLLAAATLVALGLRNKPAAIGLALALAYAIGSATVLVINQRQIAYQTAVGDYTSPVSGLTWVATPILVSTLALGLLIVTGMIAWSKPFSTERKLVFMSIYLLGASVFGTFAAQLAQDTYDVGSYYWNAWADLGNWLWATDFVLTCTALAVGLVVGARHIHQQKRTTVHPDVVDTTRHTSGTIVFRSADASA